MGSLHARDYVSARNLMKNARISWKTTVGGLFSAIGAAVVGANVALDLVAPPWLLWAGYLMSAIGPVLLGGAARDGNKSSQDHGVR